MANKPGKAWGFPDYGNDEQKTALLNIKIGMLEAENARLKERIEQLEDDLAHAGHDLPEEILDAHIVTDLD